MEKDKIIIPWFGYEYVCRPWADELEDNPNVTVDRDIKLADQCIKSISEKKHSLIIVRDIIAAGELQLPDSIGLGEYPQISCYLIQQIKSSKQNKDTPVIAAICPLRKYVMPKRYKAAGADVVFDFSDGKKGNPRDLVSVVQGLLKK